jgi:hypothetical protein
MALSGSLTMGPTPSLLAVTKLHLWRSLSVKHW